MKFILTVLMGMCLIGCSNNYFEKAKEAYNKGDYKTAANFYEKACDKGNAQGCFNLAGMYVNGRGVKLDIAKTAKFAKKACDKGHSQGCVAYKKANSLLIVGGLFGFSPDSLDLALTLMGKGDN